MSFGEMRARASDIIERMLTQLEQKSEYSPQEAGVLEKCVKVLDILENANNRSGQVNPNADVKNEDLEDLFE